MSVTDTILAVADDVHIRNGSGSNSCMQTYNTYQSVYIHVQVIQPQKMCNFFLCILLEKPHPLSVQNSPNTRQIFIECHKCELCIRFDSPQLHKKIV